MTTSEYSAGIPVEENNQVHKVGLNFLCALTAVDELSHHFRVDLDLLMHANLAAEYTDPNGEDIFISVGKDDSLRSKILVPEAYVWNVDEESDNGVNIYVNYKRGIILYQQNFICLWRQPLDLHRFPFDRHLLHMPISFQNCTAEPWSLDLYSLKDIPFSFQADFQAYTSLGHWRMIEPVIRFEYSRGDVVLILLRIERLASYYMYNIGVFAFFISLSALSVAGLNPEDFSDRQNTALTLMLTIVAFKFILAQQLPPVSYLTLLDMYIMICFLVIIVVLLENVVLVMLIGYSDGDVLSRIDMIFNVLLASFWIVGHAILLFAPNEWFRHPWKDIEDRREIVIQRKKAISGPWRRSAIRSTMADIIQ